MKDHRNLHKTHCPRGHPYDVFIMIRGKEWRSCKRCHREAQKRYKLKENLKTNDQIAWTRIPPTNPGLYWYKLVGSTTIRFQRVFEYRGHLCVNNGDGMLDVRKPLRWWAGPLQEPK